MPSLSELTGRKKSKPKIKKGDSVQTPLPQRPDRSDSMSDEEYEADLQRRIDISKPPSRLESFGRGLVGGLTEMGDSAAQLAYDLSLAPDNRRNPTLPGMEGHTDIAPDASRTVTDDVLGMRPAQDKFGEGAESVGRGVAYAAPFAPAAAAAGASVGAPPALAALAEMGFGGFANLASEELEGAGHPLLAVGAGAIAGSPGPAAARTAAKTVDGLTSNYKAIAKASGPISRYAADKGLEVTRRSLVGASSEIKRNIPDVDATVGALKKAEGRDAGLPGGVSTRQAMDGMDNDRGGSWVGAMDERLSRDSPEYSVFASRRRADFLDHLIEQWDSLGGDESADYIGFLAKYDEGASTLKKAERLAWDEVRDGDKPDFNMTSIQNTIGEEMSGLKFKDDVESVPQVFRDALDAGLFGNGQGGLSSEMGLMDFQQMRSILLETVKESKISPTRANRRAARFAVPVLEQMQKKIEVWHSLDETGKSVEYLAAKRLTRDNKGLYDVDSPVIRALDRGGNEANLFTAMRNAKGKRGNRMTSVSEADRLVRVAEQTEGGLDNLRQLARQDLFMNTQGVLDPGKANRPLQTLTKHGDAYQRILGDQYDETIELLELSKYGTRGAAGTANQAMRTGSGIAPVQFLAGLAKDTFSPVAGQGPGRQAMGVVQKLMAEEGLNELMYQRILLEAMKDKKFMRLLLEMPTDAALPAWVVNWKQLVNASRKSGTRQGVRSAASGGEGGPTP